jgi:hypothetical protein
LEKARLALLQTPGIAARLQAASPTESAPVKPAPTPRPPAFLALTAAALLAFGAAVQACPSDAQPRQAGTLLTVQISGGTVLSLGLGELAGLPATTLKQSQTVTAPGGSGGAGAERSVTWQGVLLKDVLLKADFGGPTDRAARTGVIEAVASDGYRAVYSWGEVFNSSLGEQLIVISAADGRPLDAAAGPLALRSLADQRPGPRHVRNLCAVVVRRL